MACVAVNSLVRTLELEFLQPQPRPVILQPCDLISDNKEMIVSLCGKLESLMVLFDEKRMDGVEAIKHLERKLRDVAFRVEDEIEFLVVDIYQETFNIASLFGENPQEDADSNSLRLGHVLQQAIQDIDHINEELVGVVYLQERNTALGDLPRSDKVIMTSASSQLNASQSEDILVGKENEFNAIKKMLIQHSSKQQEVVSIRGMAGIGKTTLARRVYDDPSVVKHFDRRAWVVASQNHDKRQMLAGLLKSMGIIEESSNPEVLASRLYQSLKGRRYLVVIDDVWSREAWDAVHARFPHDKNGSRVLLTTRLIEVANHAGFKNDFSHQMHFLDRSESWNLFCNKIPLKSSEFEAIAKQIVERCEGLPLAIVVVAGVVSKLNTLDEWKSIAKDLTSSSINVAEECSPVLSLSYNHLPHKLKACFLYLGVFPEDEVINAHNLGRLWIAEGFIKAFENESFEAVAEKHIQELSDRNLILVRKKSSCGRKIKEFAIHDLLHSFCVEEAQKENLLYVANENVPKFPQRGFRWLSVQSSHFDISTIYSSKSCRSIFLFCESSGLDLRIFSLVRVLFSARGSNILNCNLVGGVNLRYLYDFYVSFLDLKLPFAWNLQTVDARSNPELSLNLEVPQLRYLNFLAVYGDHWTAGLLGSSPVGSFNQQHLSGRGNRFAGQTRPGQPHISHTGNFWFPCGLHPPMFVNQNLQSISGLYASDCTMEFVTNAPFLKRLSTHGTLTDYCLGNLAHLQQLERLTLKIDCFYYILPLEKIVALKNLKKLIIWGSFLWKEVSVLCMLTQLEVLKLHRYLKYEANWELTEVRFNQLTFLKIADSYLKQWRASDDNFPKLERIHLVTCTKLKEIPSSFSEILTLKSIEIVDCLRSAVTSAKKIQEEQHDQGNTDMVVIERNMIESFGDNSSDDSEDGSDGED